MGPTPVLLLKTRSQPSDSYEDQFSKPSPLPNEQDHSDATPLSFSPQFVPVLEHKFNTDTLAHVETLVRTGQLAEQYSGMIFTSQRAVEAFSGIVAKLDAENPATAASSPNTSTSSVPRPQPPPATASTEASLQPPSSAPSTDNPDTPPTRFDDPLFPLYSVGPATTRSLTPLLHSTTLSSLNPRIYGAHTGTGAKLAAFMLEHYNALHAHRWFTYYDAPRLPFIPLVGPASGTYARRRLERDDEQLRKKGLLFLVGEVRRDVIPVCLGRGWAEEESGKGMGGLSLGKGVDGLSLSSGKAADRASSSSSEKGEDEVNEERRIRVDELEVYSTAVMTGFEHEFSQIVRSLEEQRRQDVRFAVVVVFSPQGCEAMLRTLDFLDTATSDAPPRAREECATSQRRWDAIEDGIRVKRVSYVIATIGPTTRDYLWDTFGFEADVCAEKPSPLGVEVGVRRFLSLKGLGLL
jgi:uroporphyrinogen-III synthase